MLTRGFPLIFSRQGGAIGAVSRAVTGVKMQSNGQSTFWGLVKRSSTVLGHYRSNYLATKRRLLHMRSKSMAKGQGQKSGKLSRPFFNGQKS